MTWAFEFFKVIIRQVFQVKEKFIPDSLLMVYLKYTSKSVKSSFAIKLLDRKLISHLIVNVIMPILYRGKIDEELWNKNPLLYIKNEEGFSMTYTDIKLAFPSLKRSAIFLLLKLCKKGILVKFLKLIKKELQQSTDLVRKEANLLVLGSLSKQIRKSSIKGNYIETILTDFVLCEFTSQIGFLQSRVAWVWSRF